ncbi:2-hydroxyacid dehydrogenase [Acidisoma cellulosilytica]|uniref:2-hydroxyacid dehydrogenase n=1 Tax=Acidisoma cellulosilyticum TaxID=2802395 RepID=A0A963Z6P9_9PROT|nr:2-hydroxyacid dehydrogenase [Acidisoma cellulosilyticum]MCB8883085.1 2-hydroxyacid dehydrogenase [Acidisoma cellulosilyticum]
MKRRLLQLGPLPPSMERRAAEVYDLTPLWQQQDRGAFLRQNAGHFEGALTMSRHGCDEAVFHALGAHARPSIVACFGAGFEGIDLTAARQSKVAVSVTPDVLTDCVADLAFALLLASGRQLIQAARFVQNGDWVKRPFPLAFRVSGKRLGIVGLGRIGQAIAKRAGGFDMEIGYHGRRKQPAAPYLFMPDILALADWSDFLVVACQGGPETRHLISTDVLNALGPTGILINIARGSIVDEDALVAALAEGRVGAAGLDVCEGEPRARADLLASDQVVMLPHIGASTHETRSAIETLVMDNLEAFFKTGQVLTPPS